MRSILEVLLLLAAYAALNTAAMMSIKACSPHASARRYIPALSLLALGGVLYASGVGALLILLKRGDATIMFPLAIASTILFSNGVDSALYGQPITHNKVIGTVLLLAGISLTYVAGRAA